MKIMEFMKKPKNFLVYCGSPGIGKTYLCSALVEWAIKNFYMNWRYWKEPSLWKEIRKDISDKQKTGDYLQSLSYKTFDYELLIIDDVGSGGKVNEWREELFFSLVDQQYNSQIPTIITSNFSKEQFLEEFHSRVHSRVFSSDNTIIEIHDGVDYRLQVRSELDYKMQKKAPQIELAASK